MMIARASLGLAAAPAVAPPQPGKHGVDGLFSQSFIERGRLVCNFYWFRADGGIYFAGREPMAVLGVSFSKLKESDPKNIGTYGINGNKITIQWNGQEPTTMSWYGDGMDGGVLEQVHSFGAQTRLEGTWKSSVSISGPGFAGAFASNSWTFHKDGTVTNDAFSGVDARGGVKSSSHKHQGRYTFGDTQLTIELDGTTKTYPALSIGREKDGAPRIIFLDGYVLVRQ